ncbi:AraC family transcriptional regulator [Marinicrinis lubricantis]|uniref:AraC family transcriptional regulator n=1 Tax=Marinicrinis lubricantis TaxID=2086470 RepID=A0ABW1IJE6_9BACL
MRNKVRKGRHNDSSIKRSKQMKGIYYRKSLILFLVTASIPGLIIGVFIYLFGVNFIERDLSQMHKKQMNERVHNIDDQFAYLEMDLSHWAFNPQFNENLKRLDFEYYFQNTRDITKSLVVLEGSHPLIQDVKLFIDREEPVLFQTEYYKLKDTKLIETYRQMLEHQRNIYWTGWSNGSSSGGSDSKKIQLVHKIPGESSSPYGVLVITLNESLVVNLLKTMTPYNEGLTFLMNDSGQMIFSDNSEKTPMNRLQEEILTSGRTTGTFVWTDKDKKYSVSFGKIKRLDSDWTYVSAAPLTAITSPVVVLSNLILWVSAIGLLFALLLSWLATGRVYSPVHQLIRRFSSESEPAFKGLDEFAFIENQWAKTTHEHVHLQTKLKEQLPSLRTGFLLQLLQGHLSHYTEKDLREQMIQYGWDVSDCQYQILHIQLTGYSDLAHRFPPGEEALITFAASNIVEELAESAFPQFGVMNFQNLSVGLFIMSPPQSMEPELMRQFAEQTIQMINRILGIQITLTMSRPTSKVSSIAEMYMEVERAAGFRKFVNQNQILDVERLGIEQMNQEAHYPFSLELDIIQAMRGGKQQEAVRLVSQFIHELLAMDAKENQVQQSMLQLLASIQHMIRQSGIDPFKLFHGRNMFEELSQIREPGNMHSWLVSHVIAPFLDEREARADWQIKEIVQQTVDLIEQEYMKQDISLEYCADLAGINSYTLSKWFKQVTGVNFIDWLTNTRIEAASKLLRESDDKISDIANQVGYQQRYFNRIFKKQIGLTPSQYREMNQQAKNAAVH